MSLTSLPSASAIIALHDRCLTTDGWPQQLPVGDTAQAVPDVSSPWPWIAANHRFNGQLWAEEDLARRTTVEPAEIAANKRAAFAAAWRGT